MQFKRPIPIAIVFYLVLSVGQFQNTYSQSTNTLDLIRGLNLDSLDTRVPVYYSEGSQDHAWRIGSMIAASDSFYTAKFDVSTPVSVALLSQADFQKTGFRLPYGLPFIQGGVAFLPTELENAAVASIFMAYMDKLTPSQRDFLIARGIGYEQVVRDVVDGIGLHELGHAQINMIGINTRQSWFNEFLATYFAYAFLREDNKEHTDTWDFAHAFFFDIYEPEYITLQDFNRLYISVGVENYNWYQSAFAVVAKRVYENHGIDFIRSVQQILANEELQVESPEELITLLDSSIPGFRSIVNSVGLEAE